MCQPNIGLIEICPICDRVSLNGGWFTIRTPDDVKYYKDQFPEHVKSRYCHHHQEQKDEIEQAICH